MHHHPFTIFFGSHFYTAGYLTINELNSVLNKVWDARSKWNNIGLALEVSQGDLEAIKASNNNDADVCFREILTRWLQRCSRPTWRVLADALRSPTVGHHCLANDIVLSHSIVFDRDRTRNSVNVSKGDSNSVAEEDDDSAISFECPCKECSLESYVSDGCPRQKSYPYLDSTNLTKDEMKDLHCKNKTVS